MLTALTVTRLTALPRGLTIALSATRNLTSIAHLITVWSATSSVNDSVLSQIPRAAIGDARYSEALPAL